MKSCIIIPARKNSTRLKDKLLLKVKDKPIIAWTVENCLKVKNIDKVIVATDSQEIKEALKDYPIDIYMTPSELKSGTDRVAYVAKDLDYDFIINVQGDEPSISPEDIQKLSAEEADIITLAYPIKNEDDYINPNVVKVVLDKNNNALYFSRAMIPFYRDIDFKEMINKYQNPVLKHIGIYGYKKNILLDFAFKLSNPFIEELEKLEQLRALYHGYKIKVLLASKDTIGIDTKEDYERFCEENE
ncbi:3-deoxy-manno-octulosonate cytidylyltransferase [Venenivibrio stagnispumantis]|uniref:3-deoxy-manno-octulosonate cytidylyltransferase (CMP-KDO synthetase) n=1 Tax=Venenivibrio stagnispumantis TaxID=407998 RepID=A0AA45WM50_9AQUI|nr:3-deoxy-manno-octulosonate cytidylyltransferase [Venenivibrio stagnispumantis]MCW4572867.1 3-deoxy-manno-octulosonate cytidylyltransferase [Venenivibrio stagnispumantis]SMP13072.1 3-deoxy-manno-octulosonate cytidylyltransferase (CMP-KDO synthetase) [Venenivibrio stagnispumantis]